MDNGIIVPLNFDAPIQTHLNLSYLEEQCHSRALIDYPDQELVSQRMLGVRYKDELDLQTVLLPHLISFADGCKMIQAGCEQLVDKGWYSLHHNLPYIPDKNICRGSTPKDDGTHKPTAENGAPRKSVSDTSGAPVVSQNEAIKQAEWHKEWKPTTPASLQALAILMHVSALATAAGSCLPIFFFSDDGAKFFNQIFLAPEQWHKAMTLLQQVGLAVWAAEYIAPFGVQCASNIAQGRASAHLIMRLVRDTMDAMEASAKLQPVEVNWIKARGATFQDASQSRLYYAKMFTDDMGSAVVGEDRCVRYLLSWFEVTTHFNILMRQLGCRLLWCGAIFLAIGLVTAALQKRVRAVYSLKVLLARKLTRSALQKLNGLLEHLKHVFALKHDVMANFHEAVGEVDHYNSKPRKTG